MVRFQNISDQAIAMHVLLGVFVYVYFFEKAHSLNEVMKNCPQCEEWFERSREFKCEAKKKVYVCLLDDILVPREICIDDVHIQSGIGGCPFVTMRDNEPIIAHELSFHACPEERYGCPPKNHGGYDLSEICIYPACVGHNYDNTDNTPASYSTSQNYKADTTTYHPDENTDKDGNSFLTSNEFYFISVVVFVILSILLYHCICKDIGKQCKIGRNVKNLRCEEEKSVVDALIESGAVSPKDDRRSQEDDRQSQENDRQCQEDDRQSQEDDEKLLLESLIPRAVGSGGPFQMNDDHKTICNNLERLLFSCQYEEFETKLSNYYYRSTVDVDLKCHLYCLGVHSDLFQGKSNKLEEQNFVEMMKECASTSNPFYFTVQLLSAIGRFYFHTKENDKLKTTLHAIVQNVEQDKSLFHGRSAGWVFFDYSRYHKQAIRLKRTKEDMKEINQDLIKAENYLTNAVQCFNDEDSIESDHGKSIAKLEMVALISRWYGGKEVEFDTEAMDLTKCEEILNDIEYSDRSLDVELKAQFLKAKSIYFIRKNNEVQAMKVLEELNKLINHYGRNGMQGEVKIMLEYLKDMGNNAHELTLP